jgi:adenosylcobinamide-phosphate synthase
MVTISTGPRRSVWTVGGAAGSATGAAGARGLVAAVRPRRAAHVWRAVREQAPAHPSPNAGVAEAAFAAALGLRLGGVNRYGGRVEQRVALGWGPAPVPADIARAVDLLDDVTAALALVTAGAGAWAACAGNGARAAGAPAAGAQVSKRP